MKIRKNALEWSVFAASAVVALTLAVLVRGALREPTQTPDLTVSTGAAAATREGFRLPVIVRNDHGPTARQAKIEVTLRSGGTEIDRAELMLQFVPQQSERHGWVSFRRDPRCCEVAARAVSFEAP